MADIILPGLPQSGTNLQIKILNGHVVIEMSRVADTITLSAQNAAEVARALAAASRDLARMQGLLRLEDMEGE